MEDLCIIQIFNIISIPRITNELHQKLYDHFPNVPIWMDCNCGRFFNSKSPPKSLKLYWSIWMDSNDSQFNMWNDFDLSFALMYALSQFLFQVTCFTLVNEFFPIFKDFNRFNPSTLKVFTDTKQSSPISIDFANVNREKSRIV